MVDLDAYFARIGYDGPRDASLATLAALPRPAPAAIPFEAIDCVLDRGVDISPAAVDAKLIAGRRGGYCFEQNSLFARVLTVLGFEVEGMAARVRWNMPPAAPAQPRTHQVLKVRAEGQDWLVDVGFGGCVLTAPLRLVPTRSSSPTTTPIASCPSTAASRWRSGARQAGSRPTTSPSCPACRATTRWPTGSPPPIRPATSATTCWPP